MKAYTGFADWLRNSNSAARFREAFALADKMDIELKSICVKEIYLLAELAWWETKALSPQEQQQ